MKNKITKFYLPYLERNKTLEDFIRDVNTLGGSFNGGWIETGKGKITVTDSDYKIIFIMTLRELWDDFNSIQQKLDL